MNGGMMAKSTAMQSHTDKYQLLGVLDPDTNEIKPLKLGDATVSGLAVQQYVWDADDLVWVKAQQPEFTLSGEIKVDNQDLEDLVADTLEQYHFSGFAEVTTVQYAGYERKDGAYYVTRYDSATGVQTYATGTGGIVAPGSYSGLSYDSFASKF
jgi:hypothetical protein